MITTAGCQARRERFLKAMQPAETLVLADPIHLRYLANFHVEALSLGADFGGVLLLQPDGHTTLYHDNRLPKSVAKACVDERVAVPWYDGSSPGRGPRAMVLRTIVVQAGGRVHDGLADPLAPRIHTLLAELRQCKGSDEIAQLKSCMRATDAGHAWARTNIKPGMTELDVYAGVAGACYAAAGEWAVLYGDFTVSTGSTKRGGSPTPHVLQPGEMFILDYSVILQGYRSDFTNTLLVGGKPNSEQSRIFDLCVQAMAAGERVLRAGVPCQQVYDAVRGEFETAGMAGQFPHHAGHGLGICHPEAPFLVRHSTEVLQAGNVITLEPGLYVDGVGGVRIEHNYHITDTGYERLSNHIIALV